MAPATDVGEGEQMKTSELGPDDSPRHGEFDVATSGGLVRTRGIVGKRWAIQYCSVVVTHMGSGLASPPMSACADSPVVLLLALDGCEPWELPAPMPDDVRAVFDRFGLVAAK